MPLCSYKEIRIRICYPCSIYVNDINLLGTPEELTKAATNLKDEFEMKDLGKTKYCLSL